MGRCTVRWGRLGWVRAQLGHSTDVATMARPFQADVVPGHTVSAEPLVALRPHPTIPTKL